MLKLEEIENALENLKGLLDLVYYDPINLSCIKTPNTQAESGGPEDFYIVTVDFPTRSPDFRFSVDVSRCIDDVQDLLYSLLCLEEDWGVQRKIGRSDFIENYLSPYFQGVEPFYGEFEYSYESGNHIVLIRMLTPQELKARGLCEEARQVYKSTEAGWFVRVVNVTDAYNSGSLQNLVIRLLENE